MKRLHSMLTVAWHGPDQQYGLTRCSRSVERNQIAAFEHGVTCRQCLAALAWNDEHDPLWRQKEAARTGGGS